VVVEALELGTACLAGGVDAIRAERAHEVDAGPEAARRQWVTGPEIVLAEGLVPDEDRLVARACVARSCRRTGRLAAVGRRTG
jgi:hypothetical protein